MANYFDEKRRNNSLVTVEALLSDTENYGPNVFRIPDYQRGYAWESNKQVNDLWNDIIRALKNPNKISKHYTGMLTLEEMDDQEKNFEYLNGYNAFYVVDGQQRLTTIIIFLASIFKFLEDENNENLQGEYLKKGNIYRFFYSNKNDGDTRSFFENRIYLNNLVEKDMLNIYLKNLDNCKKFIDDKLTKNSDIVKEILDVILHRLIFNIYFVTKDFDVRVTFETMNNRGKKLSNLELLKNRLMYLSSFFNVNEGDLLRDKINFVWKNIYKNLSYKNTFLNDDEYLQAHWFIYHNSLSKRRGDTYVSEILNEEFSIENPIFSSLNSNETLATAYNAIDSYIKSLDKYSEIWGIINNPIEKYPDAKLLKGEEYLDEKKYLTKLNRITSTKFAKSTIMAFYGDNDLSIKEKLKFYKKLEFSLFFRKCIGQNKNDYSSLIKHARELIKAKNENKQKILYETLDTIGVYINENNLENYLFNEFENFNNYLRDKQSFFYNRDSLKYFLYEYDEYLQVSNVTTHSVDWSSVNMNSIEHILPQNTEKCEYWQIVLSPLNHDEAKINKITNSLGNLLLLSKGENSSLKNFSFKTKRTASFESEKYAYCYGSRSAQKVASTNENWTLFDIYKREQELFQFMYDRWFRDFTAITEEEFLKMINSFENISIGEQPALSDNLITKLNYFDCTNENKIRVQKTTNEDDWFSKLRTYFDSSRYSIWLNKKYKAYVKNGFAFRVHSNNIECGFEDDKGTEYAAFYELLTKKFTVLYKSNWEAVDLEKDNSEMLRYFVRSFTLFLKQNEDIIKKLIDLTEKKQTNDFAINDNPTWFDDLVKHFNLDSFKIEKMNGHKNYKKGLFSFRKYKNRIECGFEDENDDAYEVFYFMDTNDLRINKLKKDHRAGNDVDINDLTSETGKYFKQCFLSYLCDHFNKEVSDINILLSK